MQPLPVYVVYIFLLAVFATVGFILYAFWTAHRKRVVIYMTAAVLVAWMYFQMSLAEAGFYTTFDGKPRFLLAVAPPLLFIIALFVIRGSREQFLAKISLPVLTLLSVVRIPVEFCIDQWYHAGMVPQLMTFEGRNFDIISGITAPVVFFLALRASRGGKISGKINRPLLIGWNILCLLLLVNIVVNAVTSIPGPLQMQAFDQPNMAVLIYPFIWLPCLIVPAVLFTHLVSLWRLLFNKALPIKE